MASVTVAQQQEIEKLLNLLTWQWSRLPEVEAEIDQWDLVDQLVFIEEWPLEEMRFQELARHVAEAALSPDQLARYQALERLMARNHPIIHRLQAR